MGEVSERPQRAPGIAPAFALTWLAYASYYLGRKGLSVTKARIERELSLGPGSLAAIDTGFLVAYAIGQFLLGPVGDRIGARRLIGAGLLLSAIACAAFGQASGAAVLIAAFTLNGLAQSAGWPGCNKAMGGWTEGRSDRGALMGLWSTCYQVGGVAATALAAWLLARGWRAAFRVPSLCMALVGALVLLRLRERPAQRAHEAAGPVRAVDRRRLYRDPAIWSYGAAYFALKLIRYSLLFWLPYYLHKELHFSESRAGYLSTAFDVGGAVGSLSIGLLSDRLRGLSRAGWSALFMVGLAGALLAFALVSPTGALANVVLLGAIGFLLFGPDSLLSGAAAQDAGGPGAAATAAGIVNGVGSVGAILQGTITVAVSTRYGWSRLFALFVVLALVGALVLAPWVTPRRRRVG